MKKILFGILALGAMVSCKKEDKKCDLNAANFVGSYKTTAVTYKADAATAPVDEFATYPACEKDDLIIFNSNNTVTFSDAGVVCASPGNDTGVYILNGSQLNLDGEIYTITSFDCNGATLTSAGSVAGELSTITVVKQ